MIPLPNRTFADIKQLPEVIFTTPDGQASSTVFWGDPVNNSESSGVAFQANESLANSQVIVGTRFTLGTVFFRNGIVRGGTSPNELGFELRNFSFEVNGFPNTVSLSTNVDVITQPNNDPEITSANNNDGLNINNVFPSGNFGLLGVNFFIAETLTAFGSLDGVIFETFTRNSEGIDEPSYELVLLGFGEVTEGTGFISAENNRVLSSTQEDAPVGSTIRLIDDDIATNQDDVLIGTDDPDDIQGLSSDDSIAGAGGDDTLRGDNGQDVIDGGAGNDSIFGGASDDQLSGRNGSDTLFGDNGRDFLDGGLENDFLDGGASDDELFGRDGDDTLLGGAGRDTLNGDAGNDSLDGGSSDDQLFGQAGDDTLIGGVGRDTLNGGIGNDFLTGGSSPDTFVLASGEGTDTITDFGVGNDIIGLSGGLSFNDLSFNGSDILSGEEVVATLTGFDATSLTESNFVIL